MAILFARIKEPVCGPILCNRSMGNGLLMVFYMLLPVCAW